MRGRLALFGQHQIPSVEAVLASIGDEVAGQPHTVFARLREEVTAAAAVDADDRWLRYQCDARHAIP